MKLAKALILTAALFLVIPGALRAESLGDIHVSYLDGDVQVAPVDGSDWLPASINMPLQQGDRLWVPEEARLELQFMSGAVIRLDRESVLDILALDKASAQVYLAQGRAYFNSWNLPEGSLEVFTPLASVRAVNRSIFKADVTEDGTTDITVLKGVLDVDSRGGTTPVSAGNRVTVRDPGYADFASPGYPDAWEEWNRERDTRFADEGEGESYRYLPAELRTYSADFDTYGRWMYAEGYDHVWVPSGIYASDWAPYRVGRWVWVGGDYVWVSYEPWGWAPYHYGRWVFVSGIGWCWVPPAAGAVYWGPGFVSWIYTPSYVAWLPLAPGEIYYGYGHYGPGSVNITNITIYNAPKRVVYKNIHVHNSVTVISRDGFLTGKDRPVRIKENPFTREKTVYGRPQWKPQKETRVPVMKEIPQRRLPPQRFRELTVMEIRRERAVSPKRPQPAIRRSEACPVVTVPAQKERRPFVAPRQPEQRPVQQRPFTTKPDEKQRSLREAVQERQEREVRTKPMTPPPSRTPGATPQRGRPAQEEMNQRSQPPSKALGRPEPAMKHEPARPAQQPRQKEPTQKVRPEKREREFEGQAQGDRERQKGPEDSGKGRGN